MATTKALDAATVELAAAWVMEQFQQAAVASSIEEQLPILRAVAEAVVGDALDVLVEYAAASRERIEAQRSSLAVTKRQAEKQCDEGLKMIDAAAAALIPPNRATRRKRS